MELDRRKGAALASLCVAAVALLLLFGISSFGIWDPWELNPADQARDLLAGEDLDLARPMLPLRLIAAGFGLFGVNEWSGRLPMALTGLLAVLVAYLVVAAYAGRRAGLYAAIVAGTSPLFLFNARQMLGDAPAFAASALVAWTAMRAVFPKSTEAEKQRRGLAEPLAYTAAALVAIALAVWARGALLGVLAPLLAVVVVGNAQGTLRRPLTDLPRSIALGVLTAAAVVVSWLVVQAVVHDHASYSSWLGGRPRGGDPPTFETAIETIFHSFAPWSAVLPLAVGRMLVGVARPKSKAKTRAEPADDSDTAGLPGDRELRLRWVVLLWIAFGYGAHMIFTSRYGPAPFVPVVALAAAVAMFLEDVHRRRQVLWTGGVVIALLVGLLFRDYDLYPGSPIAGLGVDGVTVPEDAFNPKDWWKMVLGLFAAVTFVCLAARPGASFPDLKAPYRLLSVQLKRGLGFKIWIGVLGAGALALIVFGLAAGIAGEALGVTTLVRKWAFRFAGGLILLAPLIAAGQLTFWLVGKLGPYRMVPVLAAGLLVGAYASQGFLPALSSHFSPREVYDTFNELAGSEEELAEYRVGGRAAAYYARGEVAEIQNQNELIDYLAADEPRWAAFPTDELAAINRAYRQRTERHLFVADARSARVVLATNHEVEGRENQNFAARYVLSEVPQIQHRVGARFEDKIELVGYNLDLPHGDYVGAGESFTITWVWKVLNRIPGNFVIFLHIDGQGQRLNGDHVPVEDRYPVRLWDEGDVVLDSQTLDVPANYRPGAYTFYIGFYQGETRLEIVEGPRDEVNRARAGVLQVR